MSLKTMETTAQSAGIRDYRRESDRYLSLEQECAFAEKLARIESETKHIDAKQLASCYYKLTGDPRHERFLKHVEEAELRAESIVDLLPKSAKNGWILEIGCGTGGFVVAAAQRGFRVVGCDIASRWLVVARRRLRDRGWDEREDQVKLAAANAECLPWDDSFFEAVIADSLIEHLDDVEAAFSEWFRVLKPGGKLILWSPNRFSIFDDPHVGVRGLGFLPRAWATYWIGQRKGFWLPRTRSADEVVDYAKRAGFTSAGSDAPTLSKIWTQAQPLSLQKSVRSYQWIQRSIPGGSWILKTIGPLWQVTAVKPEPASIPIEDGRYFDRLAQAERQHWWPKAMWSLASRWLDQVLHERRGLQALDVGCGSGMILQRLIQRPEMARVTGVDVRDEALKWSSRWDAPLCKASALALPFDNQIFDLLTCLDVIQHLDGEAEQLLALGEMFRIAKPGAWLLARSNGPGWLTRTKKVPEPFRLETLKDLLIKSGWMVERATYANMTGSLLAELRSLVSRKGQGGSGHPAGGGLRLVPPHPVVGWILGKVGAVEAWIAGRWNWRLPCGHSSWILARKPQDVD